MAVSQWKLAWLTPNLAILWLSVRSFRLCESIVANPIIYRLVPRPSRFETRQYQENWVTWSLPCGCRARESMRVSACRSKCTIYMPGFSLRSWRYCKCTRNKVLAAEPTSERRSREEKWGEGLISRALYRQLRRLARFLLSSHQKYMQIVTVWFNHKLRICDMIGDWRVHRIAQIMHIKN